MKMQKIINKIKCKNNFYIYAETAFIHEGKLDYIDKLIKEAKKASCDGIKFQILINKDSAYNKDLKIYHDLDRWCFDQNNWLDIIQQAKDIKLETIVSPIDLEAVYFCKQNGKYIDAIEIHSISLNDYYILKELSGPAEMPIILGIGGRTLEDIDYTLDILSPSKNLILMYGHQSFPTKIDNIRLSKIKKYKEHYDLPMGYADHTKFDNEYWYNLVEYSYLMGARIFEKHITLKKGERRIDYESAVAHNDILELRQRLDELIRVIDEDSGFNLNADEAKYRNREKQLVYIKDIKAGEKINYSSLGFKVCCQKSSFEQKDIPKIVRCKATKDLKKNKVVEFGDVKKI